MACIKEFWPVVADVKLIVKFSLVLSPALLTSRSVDTSAASARLGNCCMLKEPCMSCYACRGLAVVYLRNHDIAFSWHLMLSMLVLQGRDLRWQL